MSVLSARTAYRLWAPRYESETAVSQLEKETVDALAVETRGRTLLDVGCGTARRLRSTDAAHAVGVDLTFEMLAHAGRAYIAAADVRALPFADASFDVVWCRLVIGHVAGLDAAYAELARVCVQGGAVVVSDLSAAAIAAGHRRTFRDEAGVVREVEHFVYSAEAQCAAARRAGLELREQRAGVVGESLRSFYADAGRAAMYDEQRGLALVLALSFTRRA